MIDPQARQRKHIRVRIVILCGVLLLLPASVLRAAYQLQVVRAAGLKARAQHQSSRQVELAPRRGTIYDRAGAELAVSVEVDSIWINPRQMQKSLPDVRATVKQLAKLLDLEESYVAERVKMPKFWVWLKRRVSTEESKQVQALKIPGVGTSKEARRMYPNDQLAANLLGVANLDGRGIEGVELMLDEKLRGRPHSAETVHDGRGAVVYSDHLLDDRAGQGHEVTLTIDKTLQHFAERELELAVRTSEARSGSVVVIDPSSGELLVVANYPTFNPNEPRKGVDADRKNRALTDQFEPGSTVKPFTMAGALASGVVSLNDVIDCSAPLQLPGGVVHDAHRMDKLNLTEIISHSSNIGISKVAASLGRERLHRVLSNFGFGSDTGLGFPAEANGSLRPYQRWYPLEAATISFGHGMSTNTLQLVLAMGALANRGKLMEPILVKRVTDAHGQTVEEALPRVRQQVVPEPVARTLTDMLVAVTSEGGTGTEAAINGYQVAGKTGTAQKAEARAGYTNNKFVSSFVGFAPAQRPRLAIAVVLDEPTVAHLASAVAAPVFRRIMEGSLRHLGVPADGRQTGSDVLARAARARRSEPQAVWPLPDNVEQPMLRGAAVGPGETMVPNLIGRSARAAVVQARRALLNVSVQGSGIVNGQQPAPGAVVQRGTLLGLQLSPPTPDLPVPPLPSDLAEAPRDLLRAVSPQPSAADVLARPQRRRGQDG